MGRVLTPAASGAVAAAGGSSSKDLKTSWPEVVGWEILKASFKIIGDRPDVSVIIYSVGTPLPPVYDPKRVIIISDIASKVVIKTPVVG